MSETTPLAKEVESQGRSVERIIRDLKALRERVEALESALRPAPAAQREEWPDPSEAMLSDWRFEAIWQAIKKWDINVPGVYEGYMGATGNHARAILDSVSRAEGPALHKIEEEKAHAFVPPPPPAGEREGGLCPKCGHDPRHAGEREGGEIRKLAAQLIAEIVIHDHGRCIRHSPTVEALAVALGQPRPSSSEAKGINLEFELAKIARLREECADPDWDCERGDGIPSGAWRGAEVFVAGLIASGATHCFVSPGGDGHAYVSYDDADGSRRCVSIVCEMEASVKAPLPSSSEAKHDKCRWCEKDERDDHEHGDHVYMPMSIVEQRPGEQLRAVVEGSERYQHRMNVWDEGEWDGCVGPKMCAGGWDQHRTIVVLAPEP